MKKVFNEYSNLFDFNQSIDLHFIKTNQKYINFNVIKNSVNNIKILFNKPPMAKKSRWCRIIIIIVELESIDCDKI